MQGSVRALIRIYTISDKCTSYCGVTFFSAFSQHQETDPQEKGEESETNSSGLQVALPFWTSSPTMTRPPTGKRLPACCYGANNKLEGMHSSS